MSRPTCIRITMKHFEENVNLLPTILRCTSDEASALVVLEHEPYDHIHAFIYADMTEKPIRDRIYKLTSERGNSVLSVSPIKKAIGVTGFCSYLVKKETTTILHAGKNVDIPSLKSHYEKVATKKISKNNKILEIEKFLENAPFDTPAELCVKVLDYYCDQSQPINRAFVGQIVTTIYLKTYPHYKYHVAKEIIQSHAPELSVLPSLGVQCGVPRGFNSKFNPRLEDIIVQKDLSDHLDEQYMIQKHEEYTKYDLNIE